MQLRRILQVLLVVASVLFGHAAAADTTCKTAFGSLVVSGTIVRIDGKLHDDMVECARVAFQGTVTKLIVKSTGGYSPSAVALGRLVAKKNIPIEVDTVCASGCAHFLLPSARIVVVHSNDLILFHNTATSMLAVIGNRNWKAADAYRAAADAEAAYYSERNVDQRLLVYPHLAQEPRCVMEEDEIDDKEHVVVRSRYADVVLPRDILEKFGLKFEGEFADTPQLVAEALKSGQLLMKPDFIRGMSFVDRDPGAYDTLAQLPDCPSK